MSPATGLGSLLYRPMPIPRYNRFLWRWLAVLMPNWTWRVFRNLQEESSLANASRSLFPCGEVPDARPGAAIFRDASTDGL